VNVSETVIFTCTNREAENYGRFLREVLFELTRWYVDKSVYEKEAVGPLTPGFLKKWSVNPTEAVYLQYEEYRSVMFKWHKNLTTAFKNCLESRDYMHVRNALAVLEKIVVQYPQVEFHGTSLKEKVSIIAAKEETRGDLQVRAQGYLALLQSSSKSWVTAAKFSSQSKPSGSPAYSPNLNRAPTPQASSSTSTGTGSRDHQPPARNQSSLNPSAPSFKPQEGNYRLNAVKLREC
jgi:THO complex subunit 2